MRQGVDRVDGVQGADSEGGSSAAATAGTVTKLFEREAYNKAADNFRGIKKRKAPGQGGSSKQRTAEALGRRRDESGDVVPEEKVRENSRGILVSDELPYVEARGFEDGNFLVIWWRKAAFGYEMDLIEAKYLHRLMGYEIEALEYAEKQAREEQGK